MRTTAPLTGRTQELQALRAVIDADSAGGPRAAVVVAEAGAGKTRLLDEALSQAEALPRHVVRIRGGELTSALPFAVLRRGMRRSIGDDDRIEALLGTRDVEGDSGRAALVDAFADRVERLALQQQVLLVVDDAHWVDEASLTVVDVLARQLASTSLHMVVAARPHPRPAALDSVLRTLRRSGAAITLDLAPLTEHDARRVTESVLGGRGSDRVHDLVERAGGNPLYCTELGLALRDRVVRDADGRLDLPAEDDALGLDVIEHNLAALDVRARTILRDAALLGTTWDPRVLALLRDASVVDVLSSLGAAFEIGVLAEEGDDLVSFRHDLVRDAVLRSTATAVAARRHRDIVLAATTAGLPAEHWAPHLTRADWTGDPQAWEWFERAAEETVSLDAAAALLDHALQTLDGDPPISFVSLQLERLLETDRLPELRQLLEQLLQRPPEAFDEDDDVLDILALRVFHARWWTMGEHREVDIGPWLERLAAQGGEMARDVAALDRLAVEAFSTPTARVTDDAAAIMDRAQARGDERLAITARSIAVICTLHVGTPDEIDAMHVRGIRQQLTSGVYPWILVDDTYFALWCGPRDHPVRDVFDEVARIAERLGPPSSSTLGLIHASDLARKGEWRAAVDLVDHIAEADRGVNLPRPSRATIPIRIYAAVGRADDAAGLLSHPVVLPFSSAPEKARDIGLHHRDAAVAALLAGDDPTDHVDTAFQAWSRTPLATTGGSSPRCGRRWRCSRVATTMCRASSARCATRRTSRTGTRRSWTTCPASRVATWST